MNHTWNAIPIPQELEDRMQQALGQVKTLHRRRMLRRAGTALGSVAVVLGATLTLAAANPALASQIPLVGNWLGSLFYQTQFNGKYSATGAFLDTYPVMEDLGAGIQSGQWTVTVDQGYTDGNTIQLSLELTGPTQDLQGFDRVQVGDGGKGQGEALVNGESAQVTGVNSFQEREGRWTSTMTVQVPQSQSQAESLQVDLTLEGLVGETDQEDPQQAAAQQQERLAQAASQEEELSPAPDGSVSRTQLTGELTTRFTLQVDRDHSFSFEGTGEDNGAQVLTVSGTPAQLVITVEKPYWGDVNPNIPEDGVQGYPVLELPDGTQMFPDMTRTLEEGGYDPYARETQQAALYFSGLPAGVGQVTLRFYENNQYQKALASFVVDVNARTATPAGEEDPATSAYQYEILEDKGAGETQNGFTVTRVVFDSASGVYGGGITLQVPEEWVGKDLYVGVSGQGVDYWGSRCILAEGPDRGQPNPAWQYDPATGAYTIREDAPFFRAAVGETVTVVVEDPATGEILCSDTRVLDTVS